MYPRAGRRIHSYPPGGEYSSYSARIHSYSLEFTRIHLCVYSLKPEYLYLILVFTVPTAVVPH